MARLPAEHLGLPRGQSIYDSTPTQTHKQNKNASRICAHEKLHLWFACLLMHLFCNRVHVIVYVVILAQAADHTLAIA
jgi:hypothetical protein